MLITVRVVEQFYDLVHEAGGIIRRNVNAGIARRLVQAMGGKIWVESEPGAGCKFSFLIPYKPAVAAPSKGKHR